MFNRCVKPVVNLVNKTVVLTRVLLSTFFVCANKLVSSYLYTFFAQPKIASCNLIIGYFYPVYTGINNNNEVYKRIYYKS